MGMYTGIRFKGYVKPEYREAMKLIAIEGGWSESNIKEFREFGEVSRADFIPCGGLSYMPDSWEDGKYPNTIDTDGFERTYNEETGYWTFQCSLKNYESTIEYFFDLLPLFIEKIEHLEKYYEEWDYSKRYDLHNGGIFLIDANFINYEYQ